MIDKEWMHRGLACCVRHNPALGGIPLGYVAVPDGHPLRRDGIDLDAYLDSHGGVTFAGFLWETRITAGGSGSTWGTCGSET